MVIVKQKKHEQTSSPLLNVMASSTLNLAPCSPRIQIPICQSAQFPAARQKALRCGHVFQQKQAQVQIQTQALAYIGRPQTEDNSVKKINLHLDKADVFSLGTILHNSKISIVDPPKTRKNTQYQTKRSTTGNKFSQLIHTTTTTISDTIMRQQLFPEATQILHSESSEDLKLQKDCDTEQTTTRECIKKGNIQDIDDGFDVASHIEDHHY